MTLINEPTIRSTYEFSIYKKNMYIRMKISKPKRSNKKEIVVKHK